jgi:predicted metal-dependent peptidase
MMCGATAVTDSPVTAYTDGWNVTYGRAFMDGLGEKEFAAIVLHENFHKMLKQLTVWKKLNEIDARRANRAADYVINLMIDDLDPSHNVASLPVGALIDDKYRGMDTKQVFDLLKGEDEGEGEGEGKGEGEDAGTLDEHKWGEAGERTEQEQKAIDDAIDQAIRQGAILAKKAGVGKGGSRLLEGLTAPTVDWRAQLAEFVRSVTTGKDESTWRKPNRRWLAQGLYMPSTYSEAVGEIVVAIDTSGSIGDDELKAMVSELVGICEQTQPSKVTLLWWGSRVVGVQEFKPGEYSDMATALKPAGGGGTDLNCVLDWVRVSTVKPVCMVVLTDGAFEFPPAPDYPTLFGMTTTVVAPWGVTIQVKGETA